MSTPPAKTSVSTEIFSTLRREILSGKFSASGKSQPDAFLCANDITAISLIKTLGKLGKRVPRDLLVTGIDDVRLASIFSPSLTTVHQPCADIAKAAVAAMLQRLRDPALPPRQILLDAPLVERTSTSRR